PFPASPSIGVPLLEVGAVAPDNVIAPIHIDVPKPAAEIARERSDIARSVPPLLRFVPAAVDTSRNRLRAFEAAVLNAATSGSAETRAQAIMVAARGLGVNLSSADATYLSSPARAEAVLAAVPRLLDRWL